AAGSDELGESVERATWVRLFQKEVESAQMRTDELQRLAEDAKRELEPQQRWFYEWVEWGKKESEDPEEGGRMRRPERESTEHQDGMKKLAELEKKNHEAGMARFMAEKEVELAEEAYDAARLDNVGETVERAVLVKMAQGEVRSAQTQLDEAKEPLEKIRLKGRVISALGSIPLTRRKVKRHEVLLEWIEQQRQEIAGGCANTEKQGGRGQSKEASSRVLRSHPTAEASRFKKPPKVNDRRRKQSTARSILGPVDPAKVSKASSKRRSPRQKLSILCDPSQVAEQMTTDSIAPKPKSKQAFKVKDAMPASLRPIHPSRVCKPGGKRPTRPRRDGTKLPSIGTPWITREESSGTSLTPSAGRKARQQSANVSLRRSKRISKQPERFRPGYT
ncbi:MAG: hypothetical protein L6R37_008433, partial [Teloschistes peruensis]